MIPSRATNLPSATTSSVRPPARGRRAMQDQSSHSAFDDCDEAAPPPVPASSTAIRPLPDRYMGHPDRVRARRGPAFRESAALGVVRRVPARNGSGAAVTHTKRTHRDSATPAQSSSQPATSLVAALLGFRDARSLSCDVDGGRRCRRFLRLESRGGHAARGRRRLATLAALGVTTLATTGPRSFGVTRSPARVERRRPCPHSARATVARALARSITQQVVTEPAG